MSIADRLRGTVESETDDGKSDKLAEASQSITRSLGSVGTHPEAGEEKIIKYRYNLWLRA